PGPPGLKGDKGDPGLQGPAGPGALVVKDATGQIIGPLQGNHVILNADGTLVSVSVTQNGLLSTTVLVTYTLSPDSTGTEYLLSPSESFLGRDGTVLGTTLFYPSGPGQITQATVKVTSLSLTSDDCKLNYSGVFIPPHSCCTTNTEPESVAPIQTFDLSGFT